MSDHPGEEPQPAPPPPAGPPPGQQPPYPGPYGAAHPGHPYAPPPFGRPAADYPPSGQAAPPGYPQVAAVVPNHPRATLALVLGITGVAGAPFFCGLTLLVSPFAWVIGHRALREVRASAGRLGGESAAQAGMVMGIIGSVLLVVLVIVLVLAVVLLAAANFPVSTPRGKAV